MEHMASELWSRRSCGGAAAELRRSCGGCAAVAERLIYEDEQQRDRLEGKSWREGRSKRLRHEWVFLRKAGLPASCSDCGYMDVVIVL